MDEFAFNEDTLMADVIDEIIRQVQALQTGMETGNLIIHYDGYSHNPQANFQFNATSKDLEDKIQEIVNTASPSS